MFRLMMMLFAFMFSWMLEADGGGNPPEDNGDKGGGSDEDDGKKDEPFLAFSTEKEHDDYLERILKERLARKERKLVEDREKVEREAREKALQEQGEYKTVAEQRQQTIVEKDAAISERDERIVKLEADIAAMKPHREANEKRVAELMENVPESVKELLADRDPLKQLEWLDKNPELAGLAQASGRPRGSRPTGKAAKTNENPERDEQAKADHRRAAHAAM